MDDTTRAMSGRHLSRRALAALATAVVLSGCVQTLDHLEEEQEGADTTCYQCHGDRANQNAAPPPVIWSGDGGGDVHQVHLQGGGWHAPVSCDSCHTVPTEVIEAGHLDSPLPAELTFGGVAVADSAQPALDAETLTCSGVYCHGATLEEGGSLTAPSWTSGEDQAACGTCHGLPPAGAHPQMDDCATCHGDVVGADGTFLAPERHVDGHVDVVTDLACDACHGGDGVAAPPVDLAGNVDPTAPGVGAHRSHLGASGWHAELDCSACHMVPDRVGAPGHIDSPQPAELVWGSLAEADEAAPEYDAETTSCAGVYCHGATLEPGGSNTEPVWTTVDGSQVECGTCHGLPPEGSHPDTGVPCSNCHSGVIDDDFRFVRPSLHIDGVVAVDTLACDSCHGQDGVAAPPYDTQGNVETSARGVGAHRAHLRDAGWHLPVACDDCHRVPAAIDDVGHADSDLPAELDWSDLATGDGATEPLFDGDALTCSGVYCHGATLSGGGVTEPDWTLVDGSQAVCGSCHGMPPTVDHPLRTDCWTCHGEVVAEGLEFVDGDRHIDGEVALGEVSCDACHGGDGNPAPPVDLEGSSDPLSPGVGAHRAHLASADWRADIACEECHQVPEEVNDEGHLDTLPPAELTWGETATRRGATDPAYSTATLRCSDVYCHTTRLPGGEVTEPVWAGAESDQVFCGSCHSLPPEGWHAGLTECGTTCHTSVVDADGDIICGDLHVNGQVDGNSTSCP